MTVRFRAVLLALLAATLAFLFAGPAKAAACDLDNPTVAQMNSGRVGLDVWAYWACADDYSFKLRKRVIKSGAYGQAEVASIFDWQSGKPTMLFSLKPADDYMDPKFAELRAALDAALAQDAKTIAMVPVWLVSKNAAYPTRPMFMANGTTESKKRAEVGYVCNCSKIHIKVGTQIRCPLMNLAGVTPDPEVTACTKQP